MFKFVVVAYRLLFAFLALGAVLWQLSERVFEPGFSAVNFFSYFTVLSNLFIAGIFLASAWIGRRTRLVALLRGAAVAYMAITGIVYALLLEGLDTGLVSPWVNTVLHQIMPVVAVLDWVLVPPKAKLKVSDIRLWLVFPAAFLVYSLVRGGVAGWYPYPFLDPSSSGYWSVAWYSLAVAAGLAGLCWAVVWAGNRFSAFAEAHPHRYPHFTDANLPAVAWKGSRRLWMEIFLGAVIFTLAAIGGWTGWRVYHGYQIDVQYSVADTEFDSIQVETENYWSRYFRGSVSYLKSANAELDSKLRAVAEERFEQCKQAGVGNSEPPVARCTAEFDIVFVTDEHIELLYTFASSGAGDFPAEDQLGLLFEREEAKRIHLADLFKEDAKFAGILSSLSREQLDSRFGDLYREDDEFSGAMMAATEPDSANFANFWLTVDEKLGIIFEPGKVAPESEGVVRAELPTSSLYDSFRRSIIEDFLPELEEQKVEERRLEAEARRIAEEAESARRAARQLVAPNRSNIDCSRMKCIALTYDDGPGPRTAELLDIFNARRAATTLFVLGSRVNAHSGVLKRAVNERHEVANHSWSHPNLTRLSNDSLRWQVDRTSRAIFDATGVYPKLMRPPEGAYDGRVAAQAGLPLALWNIDPKDWRYRSANTLYHQVINAARPGSVVVMHDIVSSTVDATPRIIDELQRQGYVLVTMSELFGINKDNIDSIVGKVLRNR